MLRDDMVLFTYLHLAAYQQAWVEALLDAGTTGVAYETVQLENGSLPSAGTDERNRRTLGSPGGCTPARETPKRWARCVDRRLHRRATVQRRWWCWVPARWAGMPPGSAAAMDAEVLLLDRSPERLRSLESDRRGRLISMVSSRGLAGAAGANGRPPDRCRADPWRSGSHPGG